MFTPAYKRYALAMLTTVYGVNLFDRSLMILLLQPIKEDLQLSDTQLGLVTGIAFALFYATLGVPISRWADRGNRVTITAIAIGLWGLTSMACMFVSNFLQLLLARIASGVGDSGCKPLTYSLLGDYFPRAAERTRAMYTWYMAVPASGLVSSMAAGWINERFGWRLAFLAIGVIGLLLAVLVKLTLREPRELASAAHGAQPAAVPPFTAVLAILWRQPSCRHLVCAMVLMFTVGYGAASWQAAFMVRDHGIGTAELGMWLGLIAGLGGLVSMLLGQYVVGRWFAQNERAQMRLAAASVVCGAPIFVAFLIAPAKEQALVALLLQTLVFSAFLISPYVMLQRLVPDDMRATVLTVVMLLANLIGMGIGPLIVGSLSDLLQPHWGENALRYAMMLTSMLWIWAAYHFLTTSRTIDEDLAKATRYGLVQA